MDSKYEPVNIVEGKPFPEDEPKRNSYTTYPGQRRPVLVAPVKSDRVLIKTAGNALQAVSRASLEQKNLIVANVPHNHNGGDQILVQMPNGGLVSATIPEGCFAGHTFFVRIPDVDNNWVPVAATSDPNTKSGAMIEPAKTLGAPEAAATPVVMGSSVINYDLELQDTSTATRMAVETEMATQNQDQDLVMVRVPEGVVSGEEIRIQVAGGRTIAVTVPPGNVYQFYVRLPINTQAQDMSPMKTEKITETRPLV